MKSLKTVFDFRFKQNTWHPHTSKTTQSIWLPIGSFTDSSHIATHHHYLSDTLLDYHSFGREDQTQYSWQLKVMKSTCFSLSLCLYVCISQKYSVSKLPFSLLICMYWPSRTSTSSQSEIFLANIYMWAERMPFIFNTSIKLCKIKFPVTTSLKAHFIRLTLH